MVDLSDVDGTNVLVAGGVLLVVGAGAWQFIGTFLVWAFWQVALYYVVLLVVALAIYALLFLVAGGEETEPTATLERVDETVSE